MYNALIIGAGQIASGFDDLSDSAVLTHAHAYKNNPSINLLGFYDVVHSKAKEAAKKWNVQAFENLIPADIISICVPDEYHVPAVLEAAKLAPKIIFLEKPVCRNIKDIEILRKINIPILVNYSRNFSVSFQNLAKRIKNNEFGKYCAGTAFYGKGFIHNGSHMLNLLNLLIDKVQSIEIRDEIKDCYSQDATKTALLKFENGKDLILIGCDCRNYTIFEFDLLFERARVRMLNSGYQLEIYKPQESKQFKDYTMLNLSERIDTDLNFAMQNAVNNILDFLNKKSNLLCTIEDGYEAIKYG